MGNKRSQKDRGYITATEWRTEGGGYKDRSKLPFKRLPFNRCAITFTPFEEPVCTDDGTTMDVVNAVPYIMKYKRHPVTGQPLHLRDLTTLHFHKNDTNEFHCPVMEKVFTEHTHIVAVKPTGNVYCWEAVEELNIKSKNWKDLLTDEPFTRKDIIHLQDPLNLTQRTIETFDHVVKEMAVEEEEGEGGAGMSSLRNVSEDMKRALGALSSSESKAAFDAGGGGKRAEAQRLLMAAKQLAAGKAGGMTAAAAAAAAAAATAGGKSVVFDSHDASTSGPQVAPGADAGGGDWRLRAPERTRVAAFKPGTHTWNTEDHIEPEAPKRKPKYAEPGSDSAAAAAGAGAAAGGASGSGRQTPQAWYEAQGHVQWAKGAHSTGMSARAFTSSVQAVHTADARQMKRHDRNPSKKGYVRITTNLGDLNVELHCDIVPRTCENFLALCDMGYYSGTKFHRSIRNFMAQGGDPLGTGLGGESIYGKTFKDELDSRLLHSGRGVLSMANSGQNTNGSQFFITYKSCAHLNYKHPVFGRVVGGLDVLNAMEKIQTDDDDRPVKDITIIKTEVFTNPFYEMEEEEKVAAEVARKKVAMDEAAATGKGGGDPETQFGKWFSNPSAPGDAPKAVRSGVGKYINAAVLPVAPAAAAAAPPPAAAAVAPAALALAAAAADAAAMPLPAAKKPKVASSGFGSFDAW
ncbi:hypothetical protein FOA52_005539 [Chlamydomonas sp. UWO 241]|nr:hypothetical protein FOA52_005539 [Chlamydomonas sp. UWO 241]